MEGCLADAAVRRAQRQPVASVRQRFLFAAHRDGREGEVGVVDHGEDLPVAVKNLALLREDGFRLLGEDVRLHFDELAQRVVVIAQAGVGGKGLQSLDGQGGQLRRDKGSGARKLHFQHIRACLQRCVFGVTGVLIVLHISVDGKAAPVESDLVDFFHAREQRGGVAQLALIGRKIELGLDLGIGLVPVSLGSKNVLRAPFEVLGDIGSFFCHSITSRIDMRLS